MNEEQPEQPNITAILDNLRCIIRLLQYRRGIQPGGAPYEKRFGGGTYFCKRFAKSNWKTKL